MSLFVQMGFWRENSILSKNNFERERGEERQAIPCNLSLLPVYPVKESSPVFSFKGCQKWKWLTDLRAFWSSQEEKDTRRIKHFFSCFSLLSSVPSLPPASCVMRWLKRERQVVTIHEKRGETWYTLSCLVCWWCERYVCDVKEKRGLLLLFIILFFHLFSFFLQGGIVLSLNH